MQQVTAYNGQSTILADMDFETYSEAGHIWDPVRRKWRAAQKGKPGIKCVGAAAYSEHPSTEVVSLAYDLKDGHGARLWLPGCPPPADLFAHVAAGGLIEAHNSSFEFFIWTNVCAARMGWPLIPIEQFRCSMAKCYSFGLPGKLGKAAEILGASEQKDKRGDKLIQLCSVPKQPSKKDQTTRRTPATHPQEFAEFYNYNIQDIRSEAAVSRLLPDLSPFEQQVWIMDQRINTRGVHIDRKALEDCLYIIDAATAYYTQELRAITGGAVQSADEIQKLRGWLGDNGLSLPDLVADTVTAQLARKDLPEDDPKRRALWIRSSLGSKSVKKPQAIKLRLNSDDRLRDLFAYYGAERTGRWAGRGPQPQNLPNSGPAVRKCENCGLHFWDEHALCGNCMGQGEPVDWCVEAVEQALQLIARRNLQEIINKWGDPLALVSGCLRGLFDAAPGCELLCSDFSAIEAVVLAALAGCEWRLDVFRTHGLIYEMSASKISGVPFDEFLQYPKAHNGEHHPLRKKVGKVAELASGYQGWLGAWKAFGADKFMNDDEIKQAVIAWRDASPEIPKLWKGLEQAFTSACLSPGKPFSYRGISYGVMQDVMFCQLPSGRCLKYHRPRAVRTVDDWGRPKYALSFEGWNSDSSKGPVGWMRMDTYGGKLTENVTQAAARDIQANAMLNLERAGYPIVLHVHDEAVAEVPIGFGAVEEFERLMVQALPWFADWPIKAAGGWRGNRYRKD